jgi:hypothetical protein
MERAIPNIVSLVNDILVFVQGSAQSMEIGEVERRLLPMVMEVGRAALGGCRTGTWNSPRFPPELSFKTVRVDPPV